MATVAELEAKVAAGGKVTPAELVAAQAAERIAEIEADRARRLAVQAAEVKRRAEVQAWAEDYWKRIDAATEVAQSAAEAARAAAAAYNAAINDLKQLAFERPSQARQSEVLPRPPVGVGMIDGSQLRQIKALQVGNDLQAYLDHITHHRIEGQINAGTLKARCPVCGEQIKPGDGLRMVSYNGGRPQIAHNDYCCPANQRVSYGARVVP